MMKSPLLSATVAACLVFTASASGLVVTNETLNFDTGLDLPFLDAYNLLSIGSGGEIVVSGGDVTLGSATTSEYNTDATNIVSVSDGGRFAYDNGGTVSTTAKFYAGTWDTPKRRSLVSFTGAGTVVDLHEAYSSYFRGNTLLDISDGATVYLGRWAGMGNMAAAGRSTVETTMAISGDGTKVYIAPSGWIAVGHSSGNFTSNRVVMTGGSIAPLSPSGDGTARILVGNGNATDALFDMRGGSIDLWVTNNSNPSVNCTVTVGPGNGEFRMSGGSVYCGDFYVGANQPGSAGYEERVTTHRPRLRMTGGTLNCNRLYLGSSNANTTFAYQEAHVDLDGGVLIPRNGATVNKSALYTDGYAHGYLTANGGTIRASAGSDILSRFDTAELGPKGLTIDNNGKSVTVSQSFSNKPGEEGALIFTGSSSSTLKPDRYYNVSKTIVKGGTLTTSSNSTWATTLVVTNNATFSLVGAPTKITVDGLVVPKGYLFLDTGDKICLTTDNIDLSGLTVRFNQSVSSGTPYNFLEFNGDVTGSEKVRNALRFVSAYAGISGNHAGITLSYDAETGKTTATMTYKPDVAALSDETVWNGPSWDADGWSDGVPTAAKVAAFSNASAPSAVSVPANAEVGAVSVASGEDYVFAGTGIEIPGGKEGSYLDVASGSATFNLPVWLQYSLPVTIAAGTAATFNGPFTGGGLEKTGKGAITLAADNRFRYEVSVGGGLNVVAAAGALDNSAQSATLTDDTLVFTNSAGDAEMAVSTPVILRSASSDTNSIVIKADSDVRLEDLTVSRGALIKRGAGRLTVVASETKNTTLSVNGNYGATAPGDNYRVMTAERLDFADDGSAPAPETRQYAGVSIAEGELVIKGEADRTLTVNAKTGWCIGMNVAGDPATFAQPELTVDGAYLNTYANGHTTIGAKMTVDSGCAVTRPTLRILNGGTFYAGNIRLGRGSESAGTWPTLAVTNGDAKAANAIRFEVTGGATGRAAVVRAKDSTIAVTGSGTGHHGIYLSGTLDADFDNCFFGGTAETGKLRYQGVSAGTMRFRNGSVFAACPVNDVARSDYAMTLVFDNAEWRWDGGDATLSYSNSSGSWVLYKPASSGSTNLRDIRMEGTGVIMKPDAGCTFTTEVPFKGTGGFVAAGDGTVKFTGGTLQFTGLLDIRSGAVDLTETDARESLTVRGPGTLKGGEIATLTISETFDDGTVAGAPVLDGVTAGKVVVDFGRDESSPMDTCDNLLVATYPAGDPPVVGKWSVSGTGIPKSKGSFTVANGEVRATVFSAGFLMIVK